MALNSKIYDQHRTAFASVSAYIVLKDGELVARIAFKHGTRCYCYFHVLGVPMVRAYAGGGGYDKASAAAHSAVMRVPCGTGDAYREHAATVKAMQAAIKDTGYSWDRELQEAGFTVHSAV